MHRGRNTTRCSKKEDHIYEKLRKIITFATIILKNNYDNEVVNAIKGKNIK